MKIKKRTIVWFVVAALCLACIFVNPEGKSPEWSDATYVEKAKVKPENEGKLVAISGHLKVVKNAKDDLIGVSFPSPKVKRYVEKLIWDSYAEEWRMDQVYEGKSKDGYENCSIEGTVSIGDFTLDDELVSRLSVVKRTVMKKDFSDDDIAHMESTGALINEDINFYYSTGPTRKRKLDKKTYMWHRDWNGKYLVHWDMWDPSKDDGVTIVGVQKGNKLTYQVLNTVSSVDKIMDKAEFNKKASGSPIDTKYGYGVLVVVFAFLGIRSLSKSKVLEKNED